MLRRWHYPRTPRERRCKALLRSAVKTSHKPLEALDEDDLDLATTHGQGLGADF